MKYFFDNNLSPRYARMLSALNVDATPLRDVFPASILDVDFLKALKTADFDELITADANQRRIAHERKALKDSGITSLYLMPFWNSMPLWPQAQWLIRHWQTIDGFCRGCAKGTCADIQHNGRARIFHLD